jgi:hypothetical protein
VCAVVGVHFFALASLLEDRLLAPLGASVTTVALVALVAALAAGIAPSTVTGVGAGALLTGFAVAALAGGTKETPPLGPSDRRCDLDRGAVGHGGEQVHGTATATVRRLASSVWS